MAIDGTELRERPWQPGTDDERFNRAPRNPNFTGGPSPQAQAYERELQTRGMSATERTKWTRADAKAFGGMPPGAKPTIGLRASNAVGDAADAVRNGADAVRNGAAGARAEVLKRQAERAAAAAGPQPGRVARAWGTTKKFGKAGGALTTVASGFGDYRIDDPEVDSSAAGTLRALSDGDFAGAGRSLSKGALETLMDLGSSATGLVDGVTSFAPKAWQTDLSGRYNRALREQFGDQLIGPDTIAAEDSTAQGFAPQGGAAPPTNPHAEANQAKPNAFALAEKQRAESEQLRQLGESFETRPGSNMARPDLGYGPIGDRTQLTNARAAEMNPAGAVKVTKGANGNPEFSGMDLRGQVSYANAGGKALPGGGWDGKGFSSFSVAPAGSNVVLGPNGSYAYATSGSGTRSAEQLQQDIANSKQQVAAQAQRLGVDVAGLSPAQALKYMGEVENARSINAAGAAAAAEYDRSGLWMNDLRDPRTLALRNASVGPTIFRNRREHDAAMRERQKNYENTWNLVAGAPDREANRELEYTKSANTLRGQEMQANASMYGSDNTLRGDMYQADLTAATAAQKAEADRKTAAHTQAKDSTAAQKAAREETVNMFRREGDKDIGAAEQRVNVADQVLPGFSTMDTASKARARPTVDSAVDLFDRMKAQTPQGMWEKLTSSDKPGLTGLPLIQGWKVDRSFGGEHYITNPKTKQTITIGSGLNDMQLKMLENATQTGSFLPKNK